MAYRIDWSDAFAQALADQLESFRQYRSEQKYKLLIEAVFDMSELLKQHPSMGRLCGNDGIHSVMLPFDFRMYYSITKIQ